MTLPTRQSLATTEQDPRATGVVLELHGVSKRFVIGKRTIEALRGVTLAAHDNLTDDSRRHQECPSANYSGLEHGLA